MQFQVPQFIEIEDKIFGPLTFLQFVYLIGGAGIIFVLYVLLPLYLAIIPMLLVGGLSISLAFIKYNDRPMISTLESAFYYIFTEKKYIWKKLDKKSKAIKKDTKSGSSSLNLPRLSKGGLEDLSWSLNIQEEIE